MRFWLALTFFLPFQSQAISQDRAPQKPFVFLNLNILYCNPLTDEGRDGYLVRLGRLIAKINALQVDLAGFQEVASCFFPKDFKWLEPQQIIAQQTGLNYSFWESENIFGLWQEGLAFYWNPKRVDLRDIRCDQLKTRRRKKLVLVVKTICRGKAYFPGGQVIHFYNTHLDTEVTYSIPQTEEILALMKKELSPEDVVIFAGDLNNYPYDTAIKKIKEAGFRELVNGGPVGVDYIFARNLDAQAKVAIVDFKSDNTSDHIGLLMTLEFP